MKKYYLPLLVLTLTLMAALKWLDKTLTNSAAPNGIISYEFSGTRTGAEKILDSWDDRAKIFAGFSLGLDYLFMPAYALSIGWAVLATARWLEQRSRGKWLAGGVAAAAGLDAIENLALTRLLLFGPADLWPQIAWGCAFLKFFLIVLALLYVIYGLSACLVSRDQQRPA